MMSCRHSFDAPTISADNRSLVVEGLINAGLDATTKISLTRMQNVSEAGILNPELSASVSIEGQNGEVFPLQEDGDGNYSLSHSNLQIGQNYRLNISVANGSKYLSDFVQARRAAPIDSLEWKQNSDVLIYVNTHDPLDSTRYYRWDYVETWNYTSNLTTPFAVENSMVYAKDSTNQTDSCWRTNYSTDIIISNSVALSHDVISHFQVATIPFSDERISKRYSILVRQYALSKDAYQFYLTLQKNTEQTGSLFDPQPSTLATNIHCISNPGETVIGYISASSVEEKRIFIRNEEVKGWDYQGITIDCGQKIIPRPDPTDFSVFNYPDTSYGPYYFLNMSPDMVIAKKACLSCLYFGGTNQKPSFW